MILAPLTRRGFFIALWFNRIYSGGTMLWIPIIYFCTAVACMFAAGETVYSEAECVKQLQVASQTLQVDSSVVAFDGTCVRVSAI
jgi:hypothetical protein